MRKLLACLVFSIALLPAPALAAQSPLAQSLLALQAVDQRVSAIGHRIAMASVDICPRTMPLAGLLVHVVDQYAPAARDEARAAFGLGDAPAILVLVPGSPADKAGLQVGDHLLSLGDTSLRGPLAKKASYARVNAFENLLTTALATGPVEIAYQRGGELRTATLKPEAGCASRVQIIPGRRINAAADGTYAQLTTGVVDFARNDDELALVIAHEMAHNILGHREALDKQGISRGLFKSFDGSAGKIKVTEAEADYLALYLMARAGFSIDAAPGFWDRFGRKTGFGILSDGTHPGRSSRIKASERTIQEIRQKQQAGQPLVPTLPYQG